MHKDLTKFKPGYLPFHSSASNPTREIPKQSSKTLDLMSPLALISLWIPEPWKAGRGVNVVGVCVKSLFLHSLIQQSAVFAFTLCLL